MNTIYTDQKPGLYTAIAAMTLTSGIINLFWGFVASATVLSTVIGVICLPITILPTILGAFEIIYAAKLLSSQPQPVKPSPSIAVFQISTFIYGNIFSAVVGILNLIFFNDQAVKEYFARLNGVRIIPSTTVGSEIPPILEAPSVPAEPVLPGPSIPEEPSTPKRVRKVAGK
ncbi:MAG: hypothetical protein JNM55_00590 [Anaerolineales bacterium]|nr:hypothetical protein [Anaerolineales bacterium]